MDLGVIVDRLGQFNPEWDGKTSVLEMRAQEYNWRQIEWAGFYFQLICREAFSDVMQMPGRRFQSGDFDAFYEFDWDLKTHSTTNRNGRPTPKIVLNDASTMEQSIAEKGALYLLIAAGNPQYDTDELEFKQWHDSLKGGLSSYSLERIKRGRSSRRLKSAFRVDSFDIYRIDSVNIHDLEPFHQGRNSNGRARPTKLMLDTRMVAPLVQVTAFRGPHQVIAE